jgi:hypothetical protein
MYQLPDLDNTNVCYRVDENAVRSGRLVPEMIRQRVRESA